MDDFNNERNKKLINSDEDPLHDYPMEEPEIDSHDRMVLPGNKLKAEVEDLNNATIHCLPAGAEEVIKNGRDLLKKQGEEAKEVSQAIGSLFQNLNKRFGFDIPWIEGSPIANLKAIMNTNDPRALELYISDGYSKVRTFLYQQFLTALTALSLKVLDPTYLMSNSLSFEDQMVTIGKLFEFLEQMNGVYEQVHVDNVGEKLENIKNSSATSHNSVSLADPNVRAYLDKFRQKALAEADKLEKKKEAEVKKEADEERSKQEDPLKSGLV